MVIPVTMYGRGLEAGSYLSTDGPYALSPLGVQFYLLRRLARNWFPSLTPEAARANKNVPFSFGSFFEPSFAFLELTLAFRGGFGLFGANLGFLSLLQRILAFKQSRAFLNPIT